ncbi:DnaB-like helicase N-terminal domain-containing protein, partial [Delftia tsuruhatensis]
MRDQLAIPVSYETERALLGGLLLDPQAWTALPELDDAAFYAPTHRNVFRAIKTLATTGAPTDPISVFEQLRR